MKILDKAAKLEKALLARMTRRTDIPRHPLEIYGAVLDAIEDATEPGARGSRIFPYNHLVVTIPTSDARQRATAEALFAEPPDIAERVRTRLRQAGCADVDGVNVVLQFVDAADAPSRGADYHIEYQRQPRAPRTTRVSKARPVAASELHLAVVAGTASRARYTLDEACINLGRLEQVVDRQQRVLRHNHVAFADNEDAVNQSVSRAHAHIRFDRASGTAHLHDDGSTHGTRAVRAGRTLQVPRGERGLALHDGDEVVLGQARIRVAIRAVKPARSRG